MADTVRKTYEEVIGVDFVGNPIEGENSILTSFIPVLQDGGTFQKVYDDTEVIQKVYN
jgi:hypothetical protein